jgi:hypothetical protein
VSVLLGQTVSLLGGDAGGKGEVTIIVKMGGYVDNRMEWGKSRRANDSRRGSNRG